MQATGYGYGGLDTHVSERRIFGQECSQCNEGDLSKSPLSNRLEMLVLGTHW